MCGKEVRLKFTLYKRESRGSSGKDWGIGYYNKTGDAVLERVPMFKLDEQDAVSREVQSNLILANVRFATQGERKIENTHPFKHEKWLFAHRGNIDNVEYIEEFLDLKSISGDTDSERFFHLTLRNIEYTDGDVIEGIRKTVNWIKDNCSFTSLNFIMSDGRRIYAFRYPTQLVSFYRIMYAIRNAQSSEELDTLSPETKLHVESKGLAKEKAVIISSEELVGEKNWDELNVKEILVVNEDMSVEKHPL